MFYWLFCINTYASPVVLMCHGFSDKKTSMNTSLVNFRSQMKYLVDNNYHIMSSNDLMKAIEEKEEVPTKSVVLTFDDGWKNQVLAMKILDDYKMPATFGLVTIFQEHNWATSLQKEDFDLYKNFTYINHSYSHDKKYLLVNPEKDLDKSEMVLKNLFNKIEPIYMYPYGIKSEILILTLKNRNYKMGYGVGSNVVNIKKVNIFNVPRFLINQKVDMPAFIKIVEKSIN